MFEIKVVGRKYSINWNPKPQVWQIISESSTKTCVLFFFQKCSLHLHNAAKTYENDMEAACEKSK